MLTWKQKDDTQHHQLFKTRCTINNKLFELIIDSGSFENIISRKVVNVLKLRVKKHPNPHSIGWITAAEKIEVKDCCKVLFPLASIRMRYILMWWIWILVISYLGVLGSLIQMRDMWEEKMSIGWRMMG